jgi:putative ATP-grasp target RiPP
MTTAIATPYGVRHAQTVTPIPVDLATMIFDSEQQITVVLDGGVSMPALKHSTGRTSTSTANQDNKGGADRDSDQTED